MRSVGATLVKLIATATSGLVSFTTNVIRPVKVTCEFSPVQEGSGDPSPENVRPISGWTGCEIEQTGKNYFNIENVAKYVSGDSFTTPNAGLWYDVFSESTSGSRAFPIAKIGLLPLLHPGTYVFSCTTNREVQLGAYAVNSTDGSVTQLFATRSQTDKSQTFTVAEDTYLTLRVASSPTTIENPMIRISGSDDNYERWNGKATIPITFTDPSTGDPMTVYGSTVTLNEDGSADLVVTRKMFTYDGTERWAESGGGYYLYGQTGINGDLNFNVKPICNILPWANTTRVRMSDLTNHHISIGPSSYQINLKESSFSTLEDFKTFLSETPLQILATLNVSKYLTYHFDNIGQLNSFLGQNNIWHDMNGDITVEYWNKQ